MEQELLERQLYELQTEVSTLKANLEATEEIVNILMKRIARLEAKHTFD